MNIKLVSLLTFFLLFIAPMHAMSNDLTYLNKIKGKTILFGHQSVGYNIVDGIFDLAKKNSVESSFIKDLGNEKKVHKGFFSHSKIGRNEFPVEKIEEFVDLVNNNNHILNIATFKLCYVDITHKTDIAFLFSVYKKNIDALIAKYPHMKIVLMTVPIRTVQSGVKAYIKKLMGRPAGGYEDNIQRNLFNQMLLNEYGHTGLVFDLAAIESTYADGTINYFEYEDQKYRALIPDYSFDGKHLGEHGRKVVASKFIEFLAAL